jgi:tetratricopeptide (TPR) repeat protein
VKKAVVLIAVCASLVAGCSPIVFHFGRRHRGPLPREEVAFRRFEREYLRAMKRNPQDPAAPSALAKVYHERGDLEKSEEFYKKALSLSPRFYAARSGLALLYLEAGRPEDALKQARLAARDNPGDATAFAVLARALTAGGKQAEAGKALRQGLEIDPENVDLLLRAAEIELRRGEVKKAEELCRQAVKSDPLNPHAAANLAQVLAVVGKTGEAVECATAAVKLPKAGASEWGVLGYAREKSGNAAGAEEAYRRALKLRPDTLTSRLRLAALMEKTGRKAEALEEYKQAASRAPRQRGALERALALAGELGRTRDVLEARLRLARAFPRDAALLAGAAGALERAGQRSEAVEVWKRVLSVEEGNLEARRGLARLWKALGKAGSATLQYKALLQKSPQDPVALEGLAALYVEEGRFKEARGLYETLVAAHPNRAGGRAMLGLVAAELGDRETAVTQLKKAVELDGKLAIAHRELADVLRKLEEYKEAAKHAKLAVKLAPHDPKSWKVLGKLAKTEGRKKDAARAYVRAVQASGGKDVDLIWAAAEVAEDAKETTSATRLYLRLATMRRERPAATRQLARLAKKSGRPGEELYWLRAALLSSSRKSPWRGRVRERLHQLYRDEKTVLAALQRYWADYARNKDDHVALAGLGALEMVRGQYQNAARSYERLLGARPRSREAAAALVLVYAKLGKPRKSLSSALRLVAIDPKSADARFACARAYGALGEERRVEIALRAAIKLDAKHGVAHNALGVLLAGSERLAEARGHFQRAAEVEPGAAWPAHNLAVLTGKDLEDPELGKRYRLKVANLVKSGAEAPPKGSEGKYWNFVPQEDR